jgi:hypothetical protein
MSQQTVTINGIVYDNLTGLPVVGTPAAVAAPRVAVQTKKPHAPAKPSHAVHQAAQKSQTLNRRIVHKAPAHQVVNQKRRIASRPDIIRSNDIKKFAPHPAGISPVAVKAAAIDTPLKPHQPHPMAVKAQTHVAAKQQPQVAHLKPSQVLKNEAISEALDKAPAHTSRAQEKPRKTKKTSRHLSIVSASFALLLLGGYFTYLNMPSLSVRVAAAQAGISASYPSYRPAGYSLAGPVAYTDGEVSMKFASNAGPQSYNISQKKMNWDSSAVEQDVNQKTSGSYSTSTTSGLTIYLYDNNASWVNDGILYSLTGDAPLSSEQIDRIATSM